VTAVRDREKVLRKLRPLFYPESVAVVGASDNPFKLGFHALAAVTSSGFSGPVYPVNPRAAGTIQGLRAYPGVSELPEGVELFVYAVPEREVAGSLREAAARGARAAVVFAGGFREVGGEGARRQEELAGIARENGIGLVGPNCIGMFNTHAPINATFASPLSFVRRGRVSLVSQSGGVGTALLCGLTEEMVGVGKFVSAGNRAALDFPDYLEYLEADPHTTVVCLFLEGVDRAREFLEKARECAASKPVLAVSSGFTGSAHRVALSHTGTAATSEAVYRGSLAQAGILRLEDTGRMVRLAKALDMFGRPPSKGVFMATHTAGPAIIISDICEREGVRFPRLSEERAARVREFLPPHAEPDNPLDMFAQAWTDTSLYLRSADIALEQEDVGCAVAVFASGLGAGPTFPAREFAELGRKHGKPVFLCLIAPMNLAGELEEAQGHGVCVVNSPEKMGHLLSDLAAYSRLRERVSRNR